MAKRKQRPRYPLPTEDVCFDVSRATNETVERKPPEGTVPVPSKPGIYEALKSTSVFNPVQDRKPQDDGGRQEKTDRATRGG